jgi:hypothetical protein
LGAHSEGQRVSERQSKCRQLEYLLRTLCAALYHEKLYPAVEEIAIHVQSFLDCESELFCERTWRQRLFRPNPLLGNRPVAIAVPIVRGCVCFSSEVFKDTRIYCFCWTQCARLSTALLKLFAPVGLI